MLKNNELKPGGGQLRILLACYRSHPFVGGQGVYIHHLSSALVKLGHAVDVVSGPPYPVLEPGIGLIKLPSLDLFAEDNAFSALQWKHWQTWSDLSEWLSHNSGAFGEPYAFGRRLRKYAREHGHKYDVLHDNQTLASALIDIKRELPVVATLHHPISIDLRVALAAEKRWWMRALIRRWHRFVGMQAKTARALPFLLTVSEASKQAALEDFGGKAEQYHVVANGIDQNIFYTNPNVQRVQNLLITTASADTPLKGLPVLIDAFAKIAGEFPKLKLLVVGRLRSGPTKERIQQTGLGDRIEFRADLEQTDIANLFRIATIAISPSLFEGFGFPAAEAMACGAPVITSDGGALPEVVGNAGLVVPKNDASALADAMKKLLLDAPLREKLGMDAQARARLTFSWERHALASIDLYHKAIHAHHSV